MKKNLTLFFASAMLLASTSFTMNEKNDKLNAELGNVLHEVFVDDNPRGTIDRNGVKYKWEYKVKNGSTFQLTVHKESKGSASLVYSTDMEFKDNVLKIYLAKQSGYKWDIDRNSFITMKIAGGKPVVTAEGAMKNMVEAKFGITEAQLATKNLPKENNLYNFTKHTVTHLIFKYKKAMKP